MIIHRVKIKEGLLGDFYQAQTQISKGTIIFLAGLPSYLHKSIFAEELARQGYHVLQPFYYGSWVSSGDFTPDNCCATLTDTIEACTSGHILDLYTDKSIQVHASPLFVGGISFGTNIVQSAASLADVQKIFLISAVPVFNNLNIEQMKFDGDQFVNFLQRGFSLVYRSSQWKQWAKEFKGSGDLLYKLNLSGNNVRVFQGSKDKITADMVENAFRHQSVPLSLKVIPESGHALNEFDQIFLAKEVIAFFDE